MSALDLTNFICPKRSHPSLLVLQHGAYNHTYACQFSLICERNFGIIGVLEPVDEASLARGFVRSRVSEFRLRHELVEPTRLGLRRGILFVAQSAKNLGPLDDVAIGPACCAAQ